jgi:hypothetical protein
MGESIRWMARATRQEVTALLVGEGATEPQAARIIAALDAAGLTPPRMRSWLANPDRSYGVSVGFEIFGVDFRQVPTHAIEDGHVDAVIAAAEEFAAASADERYICLTLVCRLDDARRLTHENPQRTAMVKRIAELLHSRLRKDVAVHEALKTTLSGDLEDLTRLADWMTDERLPRALEALETGVIDPVALRARGPLNFTRW